MSETITLLLPLLFGLRLRGAAASIAPAPRRCAEGIFRVTAVQSIEIKASAALETTGAKYTFRGSSLVKDYHHQIVFSIDGRIKSPATLYHPKTEAFDTAMVRYNLDLVCHSS